MDEAQHFSNLCTNKKEYGVVEHLDACDVRRGGRGGERGRERGGREGRVEEDKWVRSVRVQGTTYVVRGVMWKPFCSLCNRLFNVCLLICLFLGSKCQNYGTD